MSLVLSNAFKGLLLSSYVNIRFDLAIKSFEDLINKPEVEIYYTGNFKFIKKVNELPDISKLKERIPKNFNPMKLITDKKELAKFQTGQAIILCNTQMCRIYQTIIPQLNLIFSDDHQIQSFYALGVKKSHANSVKIYKL